MTASAATHRRHLARLTRHWPTRRQLARCGRLADRNIPVTQTATLTDDEIEANDVEHAFTGELPETVPLGGMGDRDYAALIDPRPFACPTCRGTNLFASHVCAGRYRCRDCGETTET